MTKYDEYAASQRFNEVARHLGQLRSLIRTYGLEGATIAGVPMSVFKQEMPVTRRESMAACLLVAQRDNGLSWKLALDRLRADPDASWAIEFWRMAHYALEHIPYLDKLPDTEGT